MAETAIEWATHVWNPTTGCDRVSPGCAHCYALELAPRLRAMQRARAEPLLGPLVHDGHDWRPDPMPDARFPFWDDGYEGPQLDLAGIDWLIVGGESGPEHRRIDPLWVRDLRDATRFADDAWCPACDATGRRCLNGQWDEVPCPDCGGRGTHARTAFFFKQWGGRTPKAGGRELDGRTWDELPRTRREATHA